MKFLMSLSSVMLLTLLLVSLNCKQQDNASEDKFSTYVQGWPEIYDKIAKGLVTKVHFPQWDIYYSFGDCSLLFGDCLEEYEIDGITEAQEKKHEAEITKMLKIWLQPLTALTAKKLIGSEADDFVYRRLSLSEFNQLPPITAGEEGAEVKIIFGSDGGSYSPYKAIIATPFIKTDADAGVLLHELGHAFGLLDTYSFGDGVTGGVQPASVMSGHNFHHTLALGDDDINGMHWLYRYHQREHLKDGIAPVGLKDCPFADYEYVSAGDNKGACRPRHLFLHNMKQAHLHEKHHGDLNRSYAVLEQNSLRDVSHKYNINAQDKAGNTGLHYEILFGAWSKWSEHAEDNAIPSCIRQGCNATYDIFPHWLHDLESGTLGRYIKVCSSKDAGKACIEINKTNHDGDTALHIAALTGYTEAVKLLLTRAEINAQIKNQQGKTACNIAGETLNSLQDAKLADLKIKPEQTTAKIQAINRARTEIVNLLTAANACQ